ncbi:AEC family transporter [Bradyrhizobium sp. LB13.1]
MVDHSDFSEIGLERTKLGEIGSRIRAIVVAYDPTEPFPEDPDRRLVQLILHCALILMRGLVRHVGAGPLDPDRDALGRRCEAERIVRIERHQRIGLGVVGRAAAVRERISDDAEVAHPPLSSIRRYGHQIDAIAVRKPALVQLELIEEHDVALAIDTSMMLLALSVGKGQNDAETSATRVRRALRHALTKPGVLAPALGILLSLSGLNLGAVAGASLDLIGQAAGGVALFLTGLILSAQSLRLDRQVVAAIGTANVVRPQLVAAIVHALPVPSEIAKVSILLAAAPSGFFGILFGVNYPPGLRGSGLHSDRQHGVQHLNAGDNHRHTFP